MRLSSFFRLIIALLLVYGYSLPISATVVDKPILSFPPAFIVSPHDHNDIDIVAFSPDGKTFLSASGYPDYLIKLWDTKTKKPIHTFTGHTDTIQSLSFSPDGQTFLSSSYDETVKLWNVQTGTKIRTFRDEKNKEVCTVKFSPDGQTFLSGHEQSTLRLRDINTGKDVITFAQHSTPNYHYSLGRNPVAAPCSIAFSPDGKHFLSASLDGAIKKWDIKTGHAIYIFKTKHPDFPYPTYRSVVGFSPDGETIVVGFGLYLTAYHAKTKQEIYSIKLGSHSSSSVKDIITFSPNSEIFAFSGQLYNLKTGQALDKINKQIKTDYAINSIAFSPDGQQILAGTGKELVIWDTETGKKTYDSDYNHSINNLAVSPDGNYVVSASGDKTLRLWDINTGETLHIFQGHTDNINTVTFSPDGKTLLSSSRDSTLKLWDIATKKIIFTVENKSLRKDGAYGYNEFNEVYSADFSPDGKFIISGDYQDRLKIWDAKTGQFIRTFADQYSGIHAVSFSPDGQSILSKSNNNTLKLWDSETGKEMQIFEQFYKKGVSRNDSTSSQIAFSPNGKVAVSVQNNSSPTLWDIETGEKIGHFSGHAKLVKTVAFSPDGMLLVSGSEDHTVKIWNTHTREVLYTFTGHTNTVTSVAFLPDGKSIVSGGYDRALKHWKIPQTSSSPLSYASYNTTSNKMILPAVIIDNKVYKTTFCLVEENRFHLCESEEIDANSEVAKNTIQYTQNGILGYLTLASLEWNDIKGVENYAVTLRINNQLDGETYAQIIDKQLIPCCDTPSVPPASLWVNIITEPTLSFPIRERTDGHTYTVNSLAFSPDGKTMVSGSGDTTIKLWNVETKELIQTIIDNDNYINNVVFSPDGKMIASSSNWDGTIKLWDINTGELIRIFRETGDINFGEENTSVNTVVFSPNGTMLLSGAGGYAILWDIETGNIKHIFHQSSYLVTIVKFSPDGKKILLGDLERNINIYDLDKVFNEPNKLKLDSGFQHGLHAFFQYEPKNSEYIDNHYYSMGENIILADFLPSGTEVLVTTKGNTSVLDIKDYLYTPKTILQFEENYANSFVLSKDGKNVFLNSSDELSYFFNSKNTYRISHWSTESGEKIKTFDTSFRAFSAMALSPDGKLIVTGHENGGLTFWDVDTGKVSGEIEGSSHLSHFVLSPDGQFIAIDYSNEGTITLWDTYTGKRITDTFGNINNAYPTNFSNDGETLFVRHYLSGKITAWDRETEKQKVEVPFIYNAMSSNTSPNGKLFFKRGNSKEKGLILINKETKEELFYIPIEGRYPSNMIFSPNSQTFAFSDAHNIKLWDVNTKEQIAIFVGHEDYITNISFSPNGKSLLSSSMDKTATLWDIATQKPVHTFAGHTKGVVAAYFSPDGKKVISGSRDYTMKWWTVPE